MRDSSVFTFLKSKYEDLYDLCTVMEKLIVLERYGLAMAVAKIILDLFCRQTKRELVFTIDVFNDQSLSLSRNDLESVHKILFDYIYRDYFVGLDEFLRVDYEFDFTYLGSNPRITNDDVYLIVDNLEVNSVAPALVGLEGDDLISIEGLDAEDKKRTLDMVEENLNQFIRTHILTLDLFDSEGNPISRPLNFEAVRKADRCAVREIPPDVELDEFQRDAVEYVGKPLVINAGPGAGKTRVIIERVLYLIENGAEPESILVITFTN